MQQECRAIIFSIEKIAFEDARKATPQDLKSFIQRAVPYPVLRGDVFCELFLFILTTFSHPIALNYILFILSPRQCS
jgi:hypothetical protein